MMSEGEEDAQVRTALPVLWLFISLSGASVPVVAEERVRPLASGQGTIERIMALADGLELLRAGPGLIGAPLGLPAAPPRRLRSAASRVSRCAGSASRAAPRAAPAVEAAPSDQSRSADCGADGRPALALS